MIQATVIRKELKEIRYYYSRKELFDKASKDIGSISIVDKIEKYNGAIRSATPRMYELYVSLYLENNTIESLSNKLGYSYDYIQKLNKKLVEFFQNAMIE